jgi:IMP dehydrogenase
MEIELGRGKMARRAYGFDEVALVPGRVTINPDEIDVSFALNGSSLQIPFLAAAMDGVVDVPFAQEMGRLGGLAVLNLDGVQTRYEDPSDVLNDIAQATPQDINVLIQ